ncbi:hypothetical protein HZS_7842 [Henneguya salminicola]|nr:hypothetical protein HZS_7842 [Henneguya salminicola]
MIETITRSYSEFYDYGEKFVQDWPLARDPIPIISISFGYLAMIFVGKYIMRNQKAFDLRRIMMIYNFFLICFSIFISLKTVISISTYRDYLSLHYKQRLRIEDGPGFQMVLVHYLYLISKIIEFTDTLIFMLRKKNNQITLFHVFHHLSVFLIVWIQFKAVPGPPSLFIIFLNSIVHVIMYSYYFLAGLGPVVQKYLWWKKYITLIQLVICLIIMYRLNSGFIIYMLFLFS